MNAPNGNNGMAEGLQAIANWTGGQLSCVSLSWGLNESSWAPSDIESTEAALQVGLDFMGYSGFRCGWQSCRACCRSQCLK